MKSDRLNCDENNISYELLTDIKIVQNVFNPEKLQVDGGDESGNDMIIRYSTMPIMLANCIICFEMQEDANTSQVSIFIK